MLAFDLYVVMGLVALVVFVTLAIVVLLLVFAVQAGLAALWRRVNRWSSATRSAGDRTRS